MLARQSTCELIRLDLHKDFSNGDARETSDSVEIHVDRVDVWVCLFETNIHTNEERCVSVFPFHLQPLITLEIPHSD